MAGEIKLNSVNFASESGGTITINNGTIGSAVAMSANQACVKTALNASGSAPVYACRAWVNFDGTTNTAGFCTIRDSGNVSSITDNNAGNWTVNFTTAMPDNEYAAFASFQTPVWGDLQIHNYNFTTSGFIIGLAVNTNGTGTDAQLILAAVFR